MLIKEIGTHLPTTAWPDVPGQYAALKDMARMICETQPGTPIETPEEFTTLVLRAFETKKASGKGEYWKAASWEPKTILRRFGELTTFLADTYDKERRRGEVMDGTDDTPF